MSTVPIDKFAKAIDTLHSGYETVLKNNKSKVVTAETILWSEYYIKKMLLVLADVERGKEPKDLDIDLA